MFKLEIATENAAFETFPAHECARILRELADRLERGDFYEGGPVRDVNGNTVGNWHFYP